MAKIKIKSTFSLMEILGAQQMVFKAGGSFRQPQLYVCQGSLYCADYSGLVKDDWTLKCCEITVGNVLLAYCLKIEDGEEVFKYFIINDNCEVEEVPENWEFVR